MAQNHYLGLPDGIRSRRVEQVNGLCIHLLEAGYELPASGRPRPTLLLLHGFPELSYSWRKVMIPLAQAGYHVIAPDQRGYGATTGHEVGYNIDLSSFGMLNLVRDQLALLAAMGKTQVHAVVGHDFGSPVAAWCALIRPDVFRSVVMMSSPFAGPPAWDFRQDAAQLPTPGAFSLMINAVKALADLHPARQHYQWYYATEQANHDMLQCQQGVHAFLRAYYHVKSADWPQNHPQVLSGLTSQELAKLPTYYVMRANQNMAETVAAEYPDAERQAPCPWLTDAELAVYAQTFEQTGFQGGLDWYRCAINEKCQQDLKLFAGRTIDVPSCFIAGRADWGAHQFPGALQRMAEQATTRFEGVHWVAGAGHWVQQEQPQVVANLLLDFLRRQDRGA